MDFCKDNIINQVRSLCEINERNIKHQREIKQKLIKQIQVLLNRKINESFFCLLKCICNV